MGSTPVRIYLFNGYIDRKYSDKQSGILATITCHTEENEKIKAIAEELNNITRQFTSRIWNAEFTTIIKISTINVLNEKENTYYALNRWGMERLSLDGGNSIYNEYTTMVHEFGGSRGGVKSSYTLDELDGKMLLRASLEKLRSKKLYTKDIKTDEIVTYGEYEPSK